MKPESKTILAAMPTRSAWARGVKAYAADLLDALDENDLPPTKENMLNGAASWSEWAWGGCGLVYNADIAGRLCSPSELKRKQGGDLPPNSREEWLDVEVRAVRQAAGFILRAVWRAQP